MRENYTQIGQKAADGRLYIDGDWYWQGLPPSVTMAANAYIDTSYGFAAFRSEEPGALFIDEASGCYDRAAFIVSTNGKISIGKFTILNGTTIVCKEQITIGSHCMLAWGTVLTDTWLAADTLPVKARQALLYAAAHDPQRSYPFFGRAQPIVLEDNCWVGFDSVILPGVRLGRGCVVGCKTIVTKDVPPYAVVAGSPMRIVKYLKANDTEEVRQQALHERINK